MQYHLKRILFLAMVLMTHLSIAQNSYTISGYIEDGNSGEKLIAANVFDPLSSSGTVSNTYGFYSITLPQDSVQLTISYIGYQSQTVKLLLNKDIDLNFKLSSAVDLAEVTVVATKQNRIEHETQMSKIDLPVEQVKKIPALLGEVDVLKTIQLLPGVQSGGEGQSGLYVRGGSPDQNLILLDGVPVYNVSHVLGIFSVFNADAIKNITLTKGGFPARYGGRLSSVLEINMKEGNMQEYHGEGSIGLITSKLALEGPIVKDKAAFLVSGRRTYVDLIAGPLIKAQAAEGEDIDVKLFFYDLNAKVNYKINDNHRVYLSAYGGADVFGTGFSDEYGSFSGGINWGNVITAARWNYKISNKLFKNTTLTYSDYNIDILSEFGDKYRNSNGDEVTETFKAKYFSGITDLAAKVDFDYLPTPKHYVRFGGGVTRHTYHPGALNLNIDFADEFDLDTLIGSQDKNSLEYALYLEDEMQFGALKANVGVHASAFGVDDEFYTSVQPRIGLNYLLSNDVALKASFSTMTQYINLLTSEALSLPTDLWVPSTGRIKPQNSWQVAAGVAKTFLDQYEISIEGYYKEMDNVISFKEGASFLFGLSNDWQDKVTQGTGDSYGVELFAQKKQGKTTGWIGYTLSWNNRQFDLINGGERFPFRYDRRHDISVVVSHELRKNINLSTAWIFGTGNAVTLPIYQYAIKGSGDFGGTQQIESLGEKNSFRMTNYHRLDMSIEFVKQKRNYERKWIIGIYNAYYHRNPYFIYSGDEDKYDNNGNLIETKRVFKEVSILPIIPSISYAFKF